MKLIKICSMFIFALLFCIFLTGCAAQKSLAKEDVKLSYYNIHDQNKPIPVEGERIKEVNGKSLLVEVPKDANALLVDIEPFLKANPKVLGKKFKFTRSDASGSGVAYEQLEDGNLWAKYGTKGKGRKRTKLQAGQKLYFKNDGKIGKQIFCLYADKNDSSTVFSNRKKKYKITLEGNSGKKYTLILSVKAAK